MPIYSVQGQRVEDLMMVLFPGQDSARYELSLKTESILFIYSCPGQNQILSCVLKPA